jgi:NADH-quinone oxidoreductase subunit L
MGVDPLTACMIVMVTFVGASSSFSALVTVGRGRELYAFLCFLSLFAAAMLGVVICQQPAAPVHVLGTGRPRVYLLIGFLVRQATCSCRREEKPLLSRASVTSDFHRHPLALLRNRHASVL